jgi:subtilisin family serine protease
MNELRSVSRLVCCTLVLLAIVVLAAGCVGALQQAPVQCSPPKTDQVCDPASPVGNDYEACQVLIVGPQASSEQLAKRLECLGYKLTQVPLRKLYPELADGKMENLITEGLNLGKLLPAGTDKECAQFTALVGWFDSSPVVYLYQIELGTVDDVVADANASWNGGAYASPNFAVGLFEVMGNPHTIGGSPWTGPGCASVPQAAPEASAFTKQWVWDSIGLGTPKGGTGVNIGVFDTSPFELKEPMAIKFPSPTPDLSLYPFDYRHYREAILLNAKNLQDHGLAVAGLAHAVAPESTVWLYRVLGNDGAGRLLDLNVALAHFLYTLNQPQEHGVINLSLGLVNQPAGAQPLQDLFVLRALLGAAYCRGVPVVAAAGNYGSYSPTDAQIPAAWTEYVLGVGASTKDRNMACFSNPPDVKWLTQGHVASAGVMAPGGQGIDVAAAKCQPSWQNCNPTNCDFGLVSRGSDGMCNTGYAYWAGTSFAAPLTSGLAARVIDERRSNLKGQALSDKVRRLIKCGAKSDGIINVTKTFDSTCE